VADARRAFLRRCGSDDEDGTGDEAERAKARTHETSGIVC
jgi:hypothetical protein